MKMKWMFLLLAATLSTAIFSNNKVFTCTEPEGTRIDYFSTNKINLKNQIFLMGRDKVSGMYPYIIFYDNHQDVAFVIGDTHEVPSQLKQGNMKIVLQNEEQISFVGLVHGAPVLASFYPKTHILIYSQQAAWPGPDYQGARAVIFYSRCVEKKVS